MLLSIFVWLEHTPRCNGGIVGGFFFTVCRVISLNNIVKLRNVVLFPLVPPLPLDNRRFFRHRILLPLSIPLAQRQRGFHLQKLVFLPEFRPEWFPRRHNRRKFYHLPLIGHHVSRLC